MEQLWTWQEQEPNSKRWGVIAVIGFNALVSDSNTLVLVARDKTLIATVLRPYAEQHHKTTGNAVRLARYELAEVVEEL